MAKFYYNGILLPEIPSDIKSFPYVVIKINSGIYQCLGCTGKIWVNSSKQADDSTTLDQSAGSLTYSTYDAKTDSWGTIYSGNYWSDFDDIIWSNYNIPQDSASSSTVYFYGSYEVPEDAYERGLVFYNGILLPELPEDALAKYPYYWIRNNTTTGYYDLVFGTAAWYYSSGNLKCANSSDECYYRIPINDSINATKWIFYKSTTGDFGIDSARTVLWSNHNIRNGSSTATNIYSYATYPIPKSDKSGMILYNGDLMPELPLNMLINFPYVFIQKVIESDKYYLVMSNSIYYSKELDKHSPNGNTVYNYNLYFTDLKSGGSWTFDSNTRYVHSKTHLWWSNHDMLEGSVTSVSIYFSGSSPLTALPKFYYNGILLPEIPSNVLLEYPYCWMRENITDGTYDLVFGKDKWYCDGELQCPIDTDEKVYTVPIATSFNAGMWSFKEDVTGSFEINSEKILFWSNHDIQTVSLTDSIEDVQIRGSYEIPKSYDCIYYNTLYLDEPPTNILAEYPYLCIMKFKNSTIQLVGSKNGVYYDGISDIKDTKSESLIVYNWSNDAWIEDATQITYTVIEDSILGLHWSNHDISYGTTSSTVIYVVGSEPTLSAPEFTSMEYVIDFIDSVWKTARPDIFSVVDGSVPFYVANTFNYNGDSTLRSGSIGHSGTSETALNIELTMKGAIEFNYTVSSESNYDWLHVIIDDVEVVKRSGSVSWTVYSQELSAGPHTVKFQYTKDGSNNTGSDACAIGYVKITGAIPNFVKKYLIRDDNKLYTIINDSLSLINTEFPLSSVTFIEYGVDEAPTLSVISSLTNPEILYWINSDIMIPSLHANIIATPLPQVIISDAILMTHSTILGIEHISVDCDGDMAIAISFDEKQTWIAYTGEQWVTLTSELSGMSKDILESITVDQWTEVRNNADSMYIRVALTTANQCVRQIYVDFLN